jgi:hypothetical protein
LKVHRNVGANHTSQICLASIGKKCPICEFREAQRKDEGDEKLISSLRPSRKNLYCVRILSIDGKPVREKTFQLFDFSDALFQEKFEEQIGDKPEFDYFPDPYEGVSIYVRFDEDSFGGFKFARPTRFEFEKREEQYTEEDLEQVPKLDDCLKIMDYEELKEMFFSGDIDSGDDDEEDEKPMKSKTVEKDEEPEEKTTRRKKRQSREEEEEDEGITMEELDKMDIDELTDYCEKNKLKIDPYEYKEDEEDELRMDMADELGLTKEEEPEEPEPEPEPARRKSKRGKEELECPFGHRFGKDNDRFDDCDDCDLWNECNETKKQSRK